MNNNTNDSGFQGATSSSEEGSKDTLPAAESGVSLKRPRGFAAMDRNKVKEIASKGGKSAHAMGVAHQWNKEEARVAGSKGGKAPHVVRGRSLKKEEV